MKKSLLLFFLLCLARTLFAQVPDTAYDYYWKNNQWVIIGRMTYTYNNSCKLFTTLDQFIHDDSLSNISRTAYSYTPDDYLAVYLLQSWNVTMGIWENDRKTTFTYDNFHRMDTSLIHVWLNEEWMEISRQIYTYNDNGSLNSKIYQSLSDEWANRDKITYTYNFDGTISSELIESWNIIQNNWEPTDKKNYIYKSTNKVNIIYEIYENNYWSKYALFINSYNVYGKIITGEYRSWNSIENRWEKQRRNVYDYNLDKTLASEVIQNWKIETNTWENSTKRTIHYTNCVLPLSLLDFYATTTGKDIQVSWNTSSEINQKDFYIQRSNDGIKFSNIGTVNAINNGNQKTSYQFTDINAVQTGDKKLYYRLQMNGKDGQAKYSAVVAINISNSDNHIVLYPNPAKDNLVVLLNKPVSQGIIRITNQTGNILLTKQLFANQQSNMSYSLNISALKPGIYCLEVISSDGIEAKKFIKN